MKSRKGSILALVILLLFVTACSNQSQSNQSNTETAAGQQTSTTTPSTEIDEGLTPFGKYNELVTVTIGDLKPNSTNLRPGETIEDNLFLKHLEERMNIKVKYDWLVPTDSYDQKVSLIITSGEIPDIMRVRNINQLNQLVESGMVEELGQYYESTASDYIKGFYESYEDKKFTTAEFDGKLMALPDLTPGYQFPFLWVRQDWMDKVGATAPKNLEDVINLAKTFKEKDPGGNGPGKTVGFTLTDTVGGVYNSFHTMDPVFGAYHSFPRQWIKGADGKYTYGTLAPETKQALFAIRDMYAQGLIDKEFAVRKPDDSNALLLSGKSGIFFGPWWMPDWPLGPAMETNPEAKWRPYLAPLDAEGQFNAMSQNPHTEWIVVRKGFKHPEIALKLLNATYETSRHFNKDMYDAYFKEGYTAALPLKIMIQYNDAIPRDYRELQKAVDSNDTSGLAPEPIVFYSKIKEFLNDPPDLSAWNMYGTRILGSAVASTPDVIRFTDNQNPGVTKTMELKWANLEKLENQMMLKIILGETALEDFDKFVEQWTKQGGKEITDEVNVILSKQ